MNLSDWREPTTRAFSCNYKPTDRSCDNAVLFTAEAFALGLITIGDFYLTCRLYQSSFGCFMRYPGAWNYCSWDDHTAAASCSYAFAESTYTYGRTHGWSWGGDKLWRFPIFVPTVRAGAGMRLYPWHTAMAALAYIANMFEPKQETSGKLILWLTSKTLKDQSVFLDLVMRLWYYVLRRKYGSLSAIFAIYFPEGHPFIEAAKSKELSL